MSGPAVVKLSGAAVLLAILAPPSARGQSAYYVDGFAGDGRCVRTCSNDGVEDQRCCFGKWLALSDFHSNGGQKALDWDYLLLEQMHLPQYCRLLEVGVDMTVSHKHVALYPHGTQCIPERTANAVTIHGLWPNYLHGYPSCCNSQPGSVPFNLPLDPVGYVATYPAPNPLSAEEMDKIWLDPATTDAYQSLCNIFNHEWQKHGLCLGYWDDTMNLTVRAAQYFRKTIETAGLVSEATSQLESWAAEEHSPSVDEIRGLYPKQIQLWCATGDADGPGLNRFMAVRTCWNTSKTAWEPTEMLDCPRETPYSSFGICDEASPVRLDKYARSGGAPGAEATSSAVGAPLLSVWLPAAVWVILTSSNPFAA